jgi:hypothetical protein
LPLDLLTAVVWAAAEAAAMQVLVGQVDHEDDEAVTKGGRRPARLFVSPPAELEPHLDGISLVALGQVCKPTYMTLIQGVSSGGGDSSRWNTLALSSCSYCVVCQPGTLVSLSLKCSVTHSSSNTPLS